MCLEILLPLVSNPDLTIRQLVAIQLIEQAGGTEDFRKMVNRMKIPPAAMSRCIDGLCAFGFAKRSRNDSDRRKVFVHLTPKGKALAEQLGGK